MWKILLPVLFRHLLRHLCRVLRLQRMKQKQSAESSTVVEGEVQNYIPSIDSRLTIVENTITPMLTETFAYNESDSAAPLQAVTYAAGFVWGCGVFPALQGY